MAELLELVAMVHTYVSLRLLVKLILLKEVIQDPLLCVYWGRGGGVE